MADEIIAPTPAANPMDMVVETNTATVEQKSPEMSTTEPKTSIDAPAEVVIAPVAPKSEEKPEPTPEANEQARKVIEAQMRANNAERQLKESQPKKELAARPKIETFDTLENYEQALIDYAKGLGRQEYQTETTQADQQRQQMALKAAIATKAQESRAKHLDWNQVVQPFAPLMDSIPILSDFIAKNPLGTEVAYELAKQPALLEQLRNSDMWAAGEQLLNIAARLKKPAVATISNAPEPIKPVGSHEGTKPKLTELASKDINAYVRIRNKQELDKLRLN